VTENGLRRLVKMISAVSGFRVLDRHDQTLLLRHGCESFFVLRAAPSFSEAKLAFLTANGLSYSIIAFYRDFPIEWRTNETVIVLLGIVLLFDPEVIDLNNRLTVTVEQMRYQAILKRVLFTICSSQGQVPAGEAHLRAMAAYSELLSRLEHLRSLALLGTSTDANSFEPIVQQAFEPHPPLMHLPHLHQPMVAASQQQHLLQSVPVVSSSVG